VGNHSKKAFSPKQTAATDTPENGTFTRRNPPRHNRFTEPNAFLSFPEK
jgi:hypothetical protein